MSVRGRAQVFEPADQHHTFWYSGADAVTVKKSLHSAFTALASHAAIRRASNCTRGVKVHKVSP